MSPTSGFEAILSTVLGSTWQGSKLEKNTLDDGRENGGCRDIEKYRGAAGDVVVADVVRGVILMELRDGPVSP